uniref:Uncharacterized protein n=1 Tax=Geospiza parvula TaxID=87175 RepID=A0A8U8B2A5_GEOPR
VGGPQNPSPPAPGAARAGPCWAAVLGCLSLACSYVGSLYVWGSPLPRDHPSVIKRPASRASWWCRGCPQPWCGSGRSSRGSR